MLTHIFLGVGIVGIVLTIRVVMEGLHAVAEANDKIAALRASTQSCQTQISEEELKNQELEARLAEIKTEFEELTQKEKDVNKQIQTLRSNLEGRSKFKIDM